jgi:phospholipid transport system substrate-binding protein
MRWPTFPRRAVLDLAVCSLIALTWLGAARAEAGAPTETLRVTFAEANRIISDPATQDRPLDRLVAIRTLFSKVFDSRGAAERALGREWQVRTAAEQNEFTSLFARFVQRGFVNWLASVAEVDGNGITVHYLGEAPERDGAIVRIALAIRGGRQVLMDHEMVYRGRRWMVRDVTIEGISLLANYRSQFDRVIRTSSYHGLVERMQERVTTEMTRPTPVAPPALNADLHKSRLLELR